MSSAQPAQPKADPPRPQQVTIGGLLAISGSVVAIVSLVMSMGSLYSAEMTDVLRDLMEGPGLESMSLSIDDMRTLAKVMIMILAVLSVTSAVLGVFVLRRDRVARIVLTGLGAMVGVLALLSGASGWVLSLYIAMSLGLLWSKPARQWFRPEDAIAGPPSWPSIGSPPPQEDGPAVPPQPPPMGRPPSAPPPGWRPPPPPPPGWRPPPPPPPGWRPPPGPPPGWRPVPPGARPPAPPTQEQPPPSSSGDSGEGSSTAAQ